MAKFKTESNPNFSEIELYYCCLSYPKWFCRIWHKDESNGKTKFEAYRKALNDLNQ